MSLDLHIISPAPVVRHGTGVYIRENGRNVELKTMEEVRAHFPDSDLLHIHEYDYTDEDYWHGNITHNMGKMADDYMNAVIKETGLTQTSANHLANIPKEMYEK